MLYVCKECGFTFFRMNEVDSCPQCVKKQLRPATDEDVQRLLAKICEREKNKV